MFLHNSQNFLGVLRRIHKSHSKVFYQYFFNSSLDISKITAIQQTSVFKYVILAIWIFPFNSTNNKNILRLQAIITGGLIGKFYAG